MNITLTTKTSHRYNVGQTTNKSLSIGGKLLHVPWTSLQHHTPEEHGAKGLVF